jgi:hypothetical protein
MATILCPGNPIVRPPAICATQFCRAQSQLMFAQSLIGGATGTSDACQKDLAKLTVAANTDPTAPLVEISFDTVQAAVGQMDFQDGTVSGLPVSALYTGPAAAAGASFQYQQDHDFGPGQTIRNLFARSPGLSVSTVFDGSTAFINPNLITNFPILNMGLLFHEALHTLGMDDTQIQKALGLTVDPNNTINITKKLTKDCAGQLSFGSGGGN